ncbi:MAG: DUF2809 domain-containing protein [Opitutae bacterium]|jgi:hypothetical protein|nr:DUF2809 domain-containing protein [Opitutae bacterium]MBT6463770.1 DUF2809 domain-containing protein [Opitutae bacterium]MBT7855116.1 DUF2809 domain-containing protein [Opitutae bacterium]
MSQRAKTFLLLLILIPLGFGTKYYQGPGHEFFNNSIAGALYVIFWCLVLFWAFPKLAPLKNAGLVFVGTSSIEFLQLWHPKILQAARDTFLGRTLLGGTFDPTDFFYYLMGACGAYFLLGKLNPLTGNQGN